MVSRRTDADKERRIIVIKDSESIRVENGVEYVRVVFGFISKAMTVMSDLEFIKDFGLSISDYSFTDYKEPSDFYNKVASSIDEMVGMARMVMAPSASKRLFMHKVETMDELAELSYRICKGLEGTEKQQFIKERIWFDVSKEVVAEMRENEMMIGSINDDTDETYDEHFEETEDTDFADDANYEYSDYDVDDAREYVKILRGCIHCDKLRTCLLFNKI